MEMIRETADAVMQLLKLLLTMLMNQVQTQVEVTADQLVPNEHALQLQHLMQEVQCQKTMLQEIANNLKTSGTPSTSGTHRLTEWVDIEEREIHRWEDEMTMMSESAKVPMPTSPTRPKSAPQPASPTTPKTASSAMLPGPSGARSRQTEAPMLSGPILARGGARRSDEGVTETEFSAPGSCPAKWFFPCEGRLQSLALDIRYNESMNLATPEGFISALYQATGCALAVAPLLPLYVRRMCL